MWTQCLQQALCLKVAAGYMMAKATDGMGRCEALSNGERGPWMLRTYSIGDTLLLSYTAGLACGVCKQGWERQHRG